MEVCSLSLHEELAFKDYIEELGGNYLSTPFSIEALNFCMMISLLSVLK
jgi:sialic acid synthase SpsE